MNKQTLLSAGATVIAIIFAILYFLKDGGEAISLTKDEIEIVKKLKELNGGYLSYKINPMMKQIDIDSARSLFADFFRIPNQHPKYWLSNSPKELSEYVNTFSLETSKLNCPKGYTWEIGFYPILKLNDSNGKKYTDFCFVPTLVDTTKKQIAIDVLNDLTYKHIDSSMLKKLTYDYSNLQP